MLGVFFSYFVEEKRKFGVIFLSLVEVLSTILKTIINAIKKLF